jgi:catechol 2,3-dioxygenase-like lactoylglutathione lyase family enzyme
MNQSFSRTTWAGLLVLTSLIAGSTRSCVSTAHADPLPLVRAVGCIGLTVSDVDRSAAFYQRVLSFEKASDVEQAGDAVEQLEGVFAARTRTVRMKLGTECLELTEYLAPRGRPAPPDARSNDRWFQHVAIVVSDMDRAYSALRAARVEHASTGPQRLPDWNPKAGGIRAFYFRDPDHHVLEVLQFPAGKGEPRWQRKDALFLGIDHTAIVVGDTEAALAFYSGALGLKIAGTSENWGTEQEHLNNVFGARLRITTLRGSAGPGVELLEYLAPRDGRPIPADEHANDLIHWQTTVFATDLDSAARRLRGIPVSLPGSPLGYSQAFLVRDPDGHVLQLTAE